MPRRRNAQVRSIKNLGEHAVKKNKRKAKPEQQSREIRPSQSNSKENNTRGTHSQSSNDSRASSILSTSSSASSLSPTKVAESLARAQFIRDAVSKTTLQTTDEYEIEAGLVPWTSTPPVASNTSNSPPNPPPAPSIPPFSPTKLDQTLAHAEAIRATIREREFKTTEEYEKEAGLITPAAPCRWKSRTASGRKPQADVDEMTGSDVQSLKDWTFVQEYI